MPDDVTKRLITQFVVDAGDALAKGKQFQELVNGIKADLKSLVSEGLSMKSAWEGLFSDKFGSQVQAAKEKLSELRAQLRAAKEELKSFDGGALGGGEAGARKVVAAGSMAKGYDKAFELVSSVDAANKALKEQQRVLAELRVQQQVYGRAGAEAQNQIARETTAASAQIRQAKQAEKSAMTEYVQATKSGYKVMSDEAKQYGQKIQQIKDQIRTLSKETGVSFKDAAQQLVDAGTISVKDGSVAMGELTAATKGAGGAFGGLAGKLGGLITIFVSLQAIIRSVVQTLREAMQMGFEFAKSIYQLDVGVNVLRRSGMDVAFSDMTEEIQRLRKEYKIFTTKDLAEGMSQLANLTRDLGLTKEQFYQLTEASAQLAIINSRSMDEVQRTIALALSSGYTEGLQRLGVSINRVTIAAQANAMGWKKGYTALTEYQRAQATLALLLDKTGKYEGLLQKYYDTLPGQIDEASANTEEYQRIMGEKLVPAMRAWKQIQEDLMWLLEQTVILFSPVITGISDMVNAMHNIPGIDALLWGEDAAKNRDKFFQDSLKATLHYANEAWKITHKGKNLPNLEKIKGGEDALDAWFTGDYGLKDVVDMADIPVEAIDEALKDGAETLGDSIEDITKKLEYEVADIMEDHARNLDDIQTDFERDIEKIGRDLDFDIGELEFDYDKREEELRAKSLEDLAKLDSDYADDVADIQWDAAEKRADIEADYREKELKEEIRYQEELRKLREEFVFDLEDALRERDALQILRLIRRYNLERRQAAREHDITRDENKREYERELSDLAEQTQHKLDILEREWKQRRDALENGLLAEIQAERDATDAKIAELRRRAEQEKKEREIQNEQRKADEDLAFTRRMEDLADKYGQEETITQEHLNNMIEMFRKTYGEGGAIDAFYARFSQIIANTIAMIGSIGGWMDAGAGMPVFPTIPGDMDAGAGLPVATTPTTTTSPTTPTTVPLPYNDYQSIDVSPSILSGEITISVDLSDDLVAEITDNTLDEVANVLTEVQRRV